MITFFYIKRFHFMTLPLLLAIFISLNPVSILAAAKASDEALVSVEEEVQAVNTDTERDTRTEAYSTFPKEGEGWWALEDFGERSNREPVLSLRHLNEAVAGENGFIKVSEDGESFVKGDGSSIRFWSVASYVYRKSPEEMEAHCAFLAQQGVNMLRVHTTIADSSEGASITDVDKEKVDKIFQFIAIAKKHGIYMTLSPYWAHTKAPASWGLPEIDNEKLWGILFISDKLQEGYKAWARYLYTTPNPYTGIALKDDPAVGIIQIKNEDSLLFWTAPKIPEPYKRQFGQEYFTWLEMKYGSVEALLQAWDHDFVDADDFNQGYVEPLHIWEWTQPQEGGRDKRLSDQLEFTAKYQRDFFAEINAFYRDELGCQQLVNAMNWKSVDPILLNDAERFTYTSTDVVAVNRYTGLVHEGKFDGYRIDKYHHFKSQSVLRNPETFPGAIKQVAGFPLIVTETMWVRPALFQTEGPFLAAAYNSLTGVDSFYWFSQGEPRYMTDPRSTFWNVDGSYAIQKWKIETPTHLGQFPAFSLAFRRGYIKEAPQPAVYEERSLQELWERKVPIISERGTYDPNRDKEFYSPESSIKQEVDRLAFFVGPVKVKYDGSSSKNRVIDLDNYIDRQNQSVKSMTGELDLNYKTGLARMNTPYIQGVTGFLKEAGGRFEFDDVLIESANDYATIAVTSLDEKALKDSERVLIQVGTVSRLQNWEVKAKTFVSKKHGTNEGYEIVHTGDLPVLIADTKAWVRVNNHDLSKAILLDPYGYKLQEVNLKKVNQGVSVKLPSNTQYLILEK